ncbi:hypothetical protein P9112_003669 [Eukaryota sp. TZLM1-RC]
MKTGRSNVKPRVDSGYNMRKFLEKHDENRLNSRFKRTAKCPRISLRRFIPLLRRSLGNVQNDGPISPSQGPGLSPRSLATDLEGSLDFSTTTESSPYDNPWVGPPNADILVLDVRTPDEYTKCHIIGSYSYPSAHIRRATNVFTPEIFKIKNKPDSVIVLYDIDEVGLIAENTAIEFLDKGVSNVAVLKGGLIGLSSREPAFLSSPFPEEWKPVEMVTRKHDASPRKVVGPDYQRRNIQQVKQVEKAKQEAIKQKQELQRQRELASKKEREEKLNNVESKLLSTTVSRSRHTSAKPPSVPRKHDSSTRFSHGKTTSKSDVLNQRTTPRGELPSYLKEKKVIQEKELARAVEQQEEENGLRLVPKEEQEETLRQLCENRKLTEKYLGDLEVRASAGNEPMRRELMEKLRLIEDAIELFSKDEVYIAE